ncbi:MAG: hypothetical protein GX539_15735 [Candidatus Cloacimonetes bacterium]|nr:hypothetical protein [Candidatus Cloacimonadota bacterium]
MTTAAFQQAVEGAPSLAKRLDRLSRLSLDDGETIRALGEDIRQVLEGIALPGWGARAS